MRSNVVELDYRISGFQRILYRPQASWQQCHFEQSENLDVTLHIRESGMTPDSDFETVIAIIDVRVRKLVLAWELELGHRLQFQRFNVSLPSLPRAQGTLAPKEVIALTDHCMAVIVAAPAPTQMPQAPLIAERWIRTLAEAGDFQGYVEEKLRRHYLLIEELWEQHKGSFNQADQATYEDIRRVRNFVSHASCNSRKVVNFISPHLPSAVVSGTSSPTVRFDRLSNEHRTFVARYEVESGRLARTLVQLAIAEIPSTLGKV